MRNAFEMIEMTYILVERVVLNLLNLLNLNLPQPSSTSQKVADANYGSHDIEVAFLAGTVNVSRF